MDIDVSKENIQPLRGGRNLTQLGTALQAQSDVDVQRQLQLQREEHEAAIRQYQGPDPLDPWFNYIQWVEQCYPKHGHEGHMDRLIKDCLQLFEKDVRYFQDRRLVKLWIKYIDHLPDPLEIYQRLYTSGIGVECSEFYRAWACYCEESGDYKKANQIYMLGLQAKAQPLDELEQAHMNFQLFFAQRMLHDDSPTKRKAASALAETRMALTSLKSFKRRNIASVPVQRVGDNIRSTVPGVVRQQGSSQENRMPQSNVMLPIYEDEPSTSQAVASVAEDPGPASLVQACCNVENEKEVGVWTNPKTKMVQANVVPHRPLPFTPYEDEGDVLRLSAKHLPYCLDDVTFDVPLCVPDPPDSTKISCYNKVQVYVDDTEYSLEEIKARKYNLQKNYKTEDQETSKSQENFRNINETLAQCSALETLANCALEPEQDHLAQLIPLAIPAIQNITKVTNMHSPGEPKVLVNLDSKEFSELSSKKYEENQRPKEISHDKENQVASSSHNVHESSRNNLGRNNLLEEFNRSLMGNLFHDSVTVNTKEARWELRNLFNDNEPTVVQPVAQQFDVQQFDIHEDRSMTMAINTKKKNEVAEARALPADKENANQFTVAVNTPPQPKKSTYYEEPSNTQVFNFNIKDASTPNMSQFKKPASSIDQSSKYPNVPKFSIDESVVERVEAAALKREETRQQGTDQHATVDIQGAGLSVIMEATREYNSSSPNVQGNNCGKNNLLEEFNRSLMGNLFHDSVTVNTKEAWWELRNVFNDNEASVVQPVAQQFDVQQFDIHEDRSMTMAINTKKKNEVAEARALPADKENANQFTVAVTNPSKANATAYYEEPSSTQVFNFNIKDASTPNMSQFKKPASSIDQSSKYPNVPKFSIDESVVERVEAAALKREETRQQGTDQHATVDIQGAGLSVIMEATREYNSKSGSSSSGQSTRTNFTGHTTNYDSMMYNNPNDPHNSKRTSMSSQSRHANGQFARTYAQKPHDKVAGSPSVPYLSHDHQYQKPIAQNYNGYSPQRPPMHGHYQQNYGCQHQQGYSNNQMMNHQQSQGYVSPNPNTYHSPQHPGMQSPHAMSPGPSGFQSPTYSNQMGYRSPGHVMMSPQHQHVYAGRPDYHYPNQAERPHVYENQHPQQQQPQIFQSPPHQTQYQNQQYYQRTGQIVSGQPQNQGYQQNYQHMHNQYNSGTAYVNANHHSANQSYNMQSPYMQAPKQSMETSAAGRAETNQQYQIYQSPQPAQTSHRNASTPGASVTPEGSTETSLRPTGSINVSTATQQQQQVPVEQNSVTKTSLQSKNPVPHKSPTSTLRNVRYEQPIAKIGQNSPDVGFSNQFLNFISNRNEPKDNANTPKFTNSPSISQKMHKNLYVSSPEQAQGPPSSGMSDSDSKDGMTTARTATPIQSAEVCDSVENQKDLSKRQLDFEQRMEVQSEDSRDSVGKESRISSVYSRQSDVHSDGYGMDVDSENSMECGTFKSTCSISLVETSDIPRPADIEFPKVIDPFNKKLQSTLLEYVKFPNKTHAEGYIEVRSVPKFQVNTVVGVGNNKFLIEKQLGKGNYGAVYLCLDLHSNKSVAVKYQKPSRPWEFYICQEIKARIKDPFMLPGYMDITTAFLGDNASLFVSEYSKYGSLLDVANKVRIATSKCINECIVILLTAEMLSILHYLHKAQIIHADIKPDNFLLMQIPTQEWRTPSLQLIDLGRAIDMSLFPECTTFKEVITTEGFTCTEMRERRPWTYQTDLYCLAGTIHVILMGSYMKVSSRLGQWNIDKKLPRYMKVGLWDKLFTTLLNVPDCNNLPDLMELKSEVDSVLCDLDKLGNLGSNLRTFANVLKCR